VIIRDLDVEGIAASPFETDAPLVVDADAPLPGPIALQLFQPVSRRHAQAIERCCRVDLLQLPPRGPLDLVRQPSDLEALEDRSRPLVGECLDHVE